MSKRRPSREKRIKRAEEAPLAADASAIDEAKAADGAPAKTAAAPASFVRLAEFVFAHAAAFVSGGCLMIMEIIASRVLAPSFGNSVYLWTSVIGLILAALSLGYYLGGIVADKRPELRTLSWALLASGLFVAMVPILAPSVVASFSEEGSGPIEGPILATFFLFLLPGVLIGACSPIAVKLVAVGGQEVGHASGRVSALGALGSIVGTFAAGFYLIQVAGNQAILIGVALALAVLSAIGFAIARAAPAKPAVALLATCVLAFFGGRMEAEAEEGMRVRFEEQTFYHRVRVQERGNMRMLLLDSTHEGAMWIDDPNSLPFGYTQYLEVAPVFARSMNRAAFVGGGSFAMPKAFLNADASRRATVYELDPVVVEVGRRFFHLDEYPRLSVETGDARRNLRDTDERYDLIFGDAYNGVRSIPAHLATLEYYTLVRDHLTLGGIYMSNIISPLAGDGAGFFLSTARTLLQVFPELYVFAEAHDWSSSHNVIIVCPRSPLGLTPREIRELGRQLDVEELTSSVVDLDELETAIEAAPILTDDYNPVEVLVATQEDP